MEARRISLIFLFILPLAWTLGPCGVPDPDDCLYTGQFFPNTCDCTRFYRCLPGQTVESVDCTDGLVYNPTSTSCILPDKASPGVCTANVPCGKPSLEECEEHGGYFPNTCHCSQFYECLPDGSVDEYICSDGFIFDPVLTTCILRDSAPPGLCDEVDACGKPTREDCITSNFFPNTCDCSQFYQCLPDGGVDVINCSYGLVFDPNTATCKLPQLAPPGLCKNEKECGEPTFDDCQISTYFPNTCDISKFYQCLPDGTVDALQCISGLIFDANLKTCVFPSIGYVLCSNQLDCGKSDCDFVGQLIPDTCDCTKYYICLENGVEEVECIDDFVFAPYANVCIPPDTSPSDLCN